MTIASKARSILSIALILFVHTGLPQKKKMVAAALDTAQLKLVRKKNLQQILVHYMAWFEDSLSSGNGKWGQHWTMANRAPGKILPDGRREIASHFYPLIGPYASADPDVLDYHLLLMKYAGIDGVIVDWYGTHKNFDYGLIERNTDSLFQHVGRAKLGFAICYEDAALIKARAGSGISIIAAAQQDFAYLQQHYFNSNNYIRINKQPLLLCFGPDNLERPWFWDKSFSYLKEKPYLLTLWYKGDHAGYMGMGEFPWIDSNHSTSLINFYEKRRQRFQGSIAGAYPGFHDFYQQGGWGQNSFTIDHQSGVTLKNTLALAQKSHLPIVQINTWNDFGEGTMIEPTIEFQYSFLEEIQRYSGISYTRKELALITRWYTLRKQYKANQTIQDKLFQAYSHLLQLEVQEAAAIINCIN